MSLAVRKRYADLSHAIRRASSQSSAIQAADAALANPSGGEPEIADILVRAAAEVQPRLKPHQKHISIDLHTFAVWDATKHPRDEKGCFSSTGAIRIQKGSEHRNDMASAISALKKGFTVKTADGRPSHWGDWLVQKYVHGDGRRDGSNPSRLEHVARAVLAVREANQGVRDRSGGQRSYLHLFDAGSAAVVFTDSISGRVRGFIYESKNAAKFLAKQKEKN